MGAGRGGVWAMRASLIVRSKDEAPRLALTLASLARQSQAAEVVVVNDGSTDDTEAVIAHAAQTATIVGVHHISPLGRSAAANAGASRASGDILIFLDGDTLAGPDFVARHLAAHGAGPAIVARGETFHLRQTRLFKDPQTGSPMPGEEARVEAMSAAEMRRLIVTREEIARDFPAIDRRAQPGIYPGAGPRRLYELEMDALRRQPDCPALWAAASGSNQSVSRRAFLAGGGFNPSLSINEHRELALRLCRSGLRMAPADGARSYHMTHRKGWRDPLEDTAWESVFYGEHPLPEVALLSVMWASLSDPCPYPAAARIPSIEALAATARRYYGIAGCDAIRRAHVEATGGRLPSA